MIPDPLLETDGPVDSLTLERAPFERRRFAWREGSRSFMARYSWNAEGSLVSREEEGEVRLYAYDGNGNQAACYRLDRAGTITGREIREWDERGRLVRRTRRSVNPETEETFTYEYDESGRVVAERRGKRVRVEKRDRDGRLEQEYLYDGDRPDLVTDYVYDGAARLVSITVRDPEGTTHRRTRLEWDGEGRPEAEIVTDGEGRRVKDEHYAYGASHGARWLERVTWVPDGGRNGRRRPREVIYRSFTLGPPESREAAARQGTLAFANGVYTGPILGERPEGTGMFRYNDESVYEGAFRDGAMSGDGRLSWPDGRMMEGRFRGGLLEGRGTCLWADGSRYDGEFRNGRMHGPGVFTWADGTRFQGLFEGGRRTDQGAWERPEDSDGSEHPRLPNGIR